jgi:short-chain fatty acids transporter
MTEPLVPRRRYSRRSLIHGTLAAPSRQLEQTQKGPVAGTVIANVTIAQTCLSAKTGEWLEHSPLLTLIVVALGGGWLAQEFAGKGPVLAISNLKTFNLIFLMLGVLLHWRPKSFLNAVAKAVPATTGILIQFPFFMAESPS